MIEDVEPKNPVLSLGFHNGVGPAMDLCPKKVPDIIDVFAPKKVRRCDMGKLWKIPNGFLRILTK